MADRKIVLKINTKSGEASVDAQGFKGKSCADATKFVKEALGKVTNEDKKVAWYEQAIEESGQAQGNLCG